MFTSFDNIIEAAQNGKKKTVAVAAAHDEVILKALIEAAEKNIATAILFGDKAKIQAIAEKNSFDLSSCRIVSCSDENEAAEKAVKAVSSGDAEMIMKGKVPTGTFMKQVLNKEYGLRTGEFLSHVLLVECNERLFMVTDGGMTIKPDLKQKISIINNAAAVFRKMGVETPKVAPLCAVEVVNPDMPETLDAAMLSKMSERGQIKNVCVDGPLALDNAISKAAAEQKGIVSDVAGDADILLVPDLCAGNILGKSLIYYAQAKVGGIIAGAAAPVILLSRADDEQTKLRSIAFAAAVS